MALCSCVRFVPVEIPDKICGCASESLSLKPGKTVTNTIIKNTLSVLQGRHELSMPELACEACAATWTTGVDDLLLSDYWPATLHFATIYATDVFFSFEEMKMAAPGLSFQAYLRMLDQRTLRFATGKISTDSFIKSFLEWEAVRYEVISCARRSPSPVLRAALICLQFPWMKPQALPFQECS
ncbi:hypothetical protein F7725_026034 [Dissostichus mawsoni]|uniref:CxC3 like cysteine cluster domain-containing protein n=1 Tax=Dissostichus mawsoni TaxID=36200 RepID=A0A7J5X6V4_DISMA|nr:hypothetical protein F7725_026034 [Dissostichus mawsoni]